MKRRKDLRRSLKLQLPGFFASLRMTAFKGIAATCKAPPFPAVSNMTRTFVSTLLTTFSLHGSAAQGGCEHYGHLLKGISGNAAESARHEFVRPLSHGLRRVCLRHDCRRRRLCGVRMAGVSLRRVHETEKEVQAGVIFSARDHVSQKEPSDQEHDDNQGDGRRGYCVPY